MEGTTCLCLTTYSVPKKKGTRRTRRVVVQDYTKISKYFPLTSINTLPNEVLLEVFDQYRSVTAGKRTGSQGWWYTLVHICRRWRQLVFASSIRLNLQLRCTFGTPVDDMINHSPPFPLVLDYGPRILKTWTAEDESGLLAASRHLPRVTEIVLSAPESTLAKLTTSMTEAVPRLETLIFHSQTSEIVLPKQFLEGGAPQLRHLMLTGASLSPIQPLLSSTTSLVSLVLERIPSSAYFPPSTLITQMRSMPHLQLLSLGFLSTIPRPGFRGERAAVAVARTELPALTQLIYRGVSAYLETLLSRLRSPHLTEIDITLFHQLTLTIPSTTSFLHDLRLASHHHPTRTARIDFAQASAAHIALLPDIFISVSCARLDFQVAAMVQAQLGLSPTLARAEELVLAYHPAPEEESHGGREEVDTRLWSALLEPFRNVAMLRVHVALVPDVERALRADQQQLLLPKLSEVVLLHGSDGKALGDATAALGAFVGERESASCPIKVSSQDLSRLAESETVKAVSSRRRLQKL